MPGSFPQQTLRELQTIHWKDAAKMKHTWNTGVIDFLLKPLGTFSIGFSTGIKERQSKNECRKVNTTMSTTNLTHFTAKTYCSKKSTWTIEIINPTLSAVYTHRTVSRQSIMTKQMDVNISLITDINANFSQMMGWAKSWHYCRWQVNSESGIQTIIMQLVWTIQCTGLTTFCQHYQPTVAKIGVKRSWQLRIHSKDTKLQLLQNINSNQKLIFTTYSESDTPHFAILHRNSWSPL